MELTMQTRVGADRTRSRTPKLDLIIEPWLHFGQQEEKVLDEKVPTRLAFALYYLLAFAKADKTRNLKVRNLVGKSTS